MNVPRLTRDLIAAVLNGAAPDVLRAKAEDLRDLLDEEARGRQFMRNQRHFAGR